MMQEPNEKKVHRILFPIIIMISLFFGLYSVFFNAENVDAHATLLEMEPTEKVVIEESPSTLSLRFNEPIEHDLAMVTVYDWNAKPIFTGNPEGDVERAPLLEFSLPELKEGTYTVKWNVVSADGHPVGGSYAFSVGKATEGEVQSVAGEDTSEGWLTMVRIIPEGLILLGAGLFWFGWLAERRNYPSVDALWKRGRLTAAVLIILGTIAEFIVYGFSLPPGIIQVILGGRWELLTQFPFVLMLFVQMLFLVLLFIPRMERGWYLVLWILLAITPAFGGHVWGMENPILALIPRVFHQIAIAFWLGALCYVILLLIWNKKQDSQISWKEFRPFFVNKMLIASGVVVISGIVMIFLQTGVTAVFTDWKFWSTLVIIKIILTIVMGGLALYQTLKWKTTKTFTTTRLIRSEWIIGLVVIVFGIWMSQIAYPIAIKTYDEILTTNQTEVEVYIEALKAGDQEMTISVAEKDGELPENMNVKVSMPQHGMGSGILEADEGETGSYTIQLPFTMPGTWLLEITATYPNGDQVEWEDEVFIASKGN